MLGPNDNRSAGSLTTGEGRKRCPGCGVVKDLSAFTTTVAKSFPAYPRCTTCRSAASKRRKSTPEAKALRAVREARWYQENKEKRRAHKAVHRAVCSGLLIRPDVCSRCGNEAPVHAHHDDYSKPLEVEWICVPCHGRLHALERATA